MELVKSRSSADLGDQNDWSRKLANVELDDLKKVCTVAIGGCANVSLVQIDSHPNAYFALKTIKKAKITDAFEREMVLSEKKILSEARNDFIVKLYKTFKDSECLYLLTDYLPGGDVFDLAPMSENAAKFYVACVVEALDYLHTRGIVHNDVKPSNLVLDAHGYAKLIDFGFAMQLEENQKSYGNSWGTPGYLPPEVASPSLDEDDDPEDEGRDRACDLWALGVLLYELLRGFNPFDPDSTDEVDTILTNVTEGIDSIQFSKEHFSEDAEDLIRNLCTYDSEFRLGYESIDEIREHRWFNNFDWSKLRKRKLTPPIVPEVKNVADIDDLTGEISESDSDVEEETSDWDNDF